MQAESAALAFEKANATKKKIDELERYQTKSEILTKQQEAMDVFSIAMEEDQAYVNYLMLQEGRIVQTHMLPLSTPLEESKEAVLAFAIHYFRTQVESEAKEIIVPLEPIEKEQGVKYTVPKMGEKLHLLALSQKNVDYALKDWKHRQALVKVSEQAPVNEVLIELKELLSLPAVPNHIECFDNSNFQGAYPVSAMVCFKNGIASKSDYRKFNIKTVVGINDFASMHETVLRRYSSVLQKKQPLPQLIIIDGGKGQLSAALESLNKLGLRGKVAIIGIAKKLEEIYYPGDSLPLYLDKKGETLKVLQHIRDEAHRFSITHHRNKRSKGTIKTELTTIKGISETTANKLLIQFKSVKMIAQCSLQEIELVVGKSKALLVHEHFKTNKQ